MVGIRKAVNDAMCLRGLNEISSMNIPLQNPLNWRGGPWLDGLDLDVRTAGMTLASPTLTVAYSSSSGRPTRSPQSCLHILKQLHFLSG